MNCKNETKHAIDMIYENGAFQVSPRVLGKEDWAYAAEEVYKNILLGNDKWKAAIKFLFMHSNGGEDDRWNWTFHLLTELLKNGYAVKGAYDNETGKTIGTLDAERKELLNKEPNKLEEIKEFVTKSFLKYNTFDKNIVTSSPYLLPTYEHFQDKRIMKMLAAIYNRNPSSEPMHKWEYPFKQGVTFDNELYSCYLVLSDMNYISKDLLDCDADTVGKIITNANLFLKQRQNDLKIKTSLSSSISKLENSVEFLKQFKEHDKRRNQIEEAINAWKPFTIVHFDE